MSHGDFHIGPAGWTAAAGVVVAAITGFFSWMGGRNSSVAVLQNALVSGFKALNDQRIEAMLEMRKELEQIKTEVEQLKGDLANERAKTNALQNLLRHNGIEIPHEPLVEVVFSPYPEGTG